MPAQKLYHALCESVCSMEVESYVGPYPLMKHNWVYQVICSVDGSNNFSAPLLVCKIGLNVYCVIRWCMFVYFCIFASELTNSQNFLGREVDMPNTFYFVLEFEFFYRKVYIRTYISNCVFNQCSLSWLYNHIVHWTVCRKLDVDRNLILS